jgi:Flp pilus assembly pilin Flp
MVGERLGLGAPVVRGVHLDRDRERGQATVESAVLVALCAIAVIVAIFLFRQSLTSVFDRTGSASAGDVVTPPTSPTCDPNYSGACLPPYPPDIDCADLAALGITHVTVSGSDPHHLDPDGDGIACD